MFCCILCQFSIVNSVSWTRYIWTSLLIFCFLEIGVHSKKEKKDSYCSVSLGLTISTMSPNFLWLYYNFPFVKTKSEYIIYFLVWQTESNLQLSKASLSPSKRVLILDLRSYASAYANKLKGGGYEYEGKMGLSLCIVFMVELQFWENKRRRVRINSERLSKD